MLIFLWVLFSFIDKSSQDVSALFQKTSENIPSIIAVHIKGLQSLNFTVWAIHIISGAVHFGSFLK